MNCRRFQYRIFEFLDGTLSSSARAAAENHLANCEACRRSVLQQRQVAESLSHQLQSATNSLQLPPAFDLRILAALTDQPHRTAAVSAAVPLLAPYPASSLNLLWRRLAWSLAAASCLVLAVAITTKFLHHATGSGHQAAGSQPDAAPSVAFIHLTYTIPVYSYRREDSVVVDALIPQVATVNVAFPSEQKPRPVRNRKDGKYSL